MTEQLEPRSDATAGHLRFHFPEQQGKALQLSKTVRAIWPDGQRHPEVNFYMPIREPDWIDRAVERAVALNKVGANIYFGTGHYRIQESTADAVEWQTFCYVDADDAPTFDRLKALTGDEEPNYLLETGGGRGHAYWHLDFPEGDSNRFRQAQKALIAKYGTDPAVHDMARIMRLAGTINWPNEKKKKMGRVPELVGGIF